MLSARQRLSRARIIFHLPSRWPLHILDILSSDMLVRPPLNQIKPRSESRWWLSEKCDATSLARLRQLTGWTLHGWNISWKQQSNELPGTSWILVKNVIAPSSRRTCCTAAADFSFLLLLLLLFFFVAKMGVTAPSESQLLRFGICQAEIQLDCDLAFRKINLTSTWTSLNPRCWQGM